MHWQSSGKIGKESSRGGNQEFAQAHTVSQAKVGGEVVRTLFAKNIYIIYNLK